MHDRVFDLSDLVEIHPLSPALDKESQRRDFGRYAADFYAFSLAHFSKNNDRPNDFTD